MDIREILHQIRNGSSDRQISRDLRIDRRTVKRYREWAQEQGLLAGEIPEIEVLQELAASTLATTPPPQNVSSVEPYQEMVKRLVDEKVETAAIHQRLKERGFGGLYWAVYRYVRTLKPQDQKTTVRVERKPGEEIQVDFGYGGMMIEPETGKLRKTWAFVMTLSWSRHQYVEFVFDQTIETWVQCPSGTLYFVMSINTPITSSKLIPVA